MKTDSLWEILVLSAILTTHSSRANTGCPETSIKNSHFPVIHMCTNENASGVTGLFLDAFVPVNTITTCNCSLHVSAPVTISVFAVKLPEKMCASTLTIDAQWSYTCAGVDNSNGYGNTRRTITKNSNLIQLETSNASNNVIYCLNVVSRGSMAIQCYPPVGKSMTRSTRPDHRATSLRSTTPGSTRRVSTKSEKVVVTRSPPTEAVKSEISDTTVSAERTNRQSDPESFPVPAVAGGAGAVVVIAVVIIVVVVFVKRRGRDKKNGRNSDSDGDYCNMDADPYKYQNTKSFVRHPGASADCHQNQNDSQTIRSPSDDYASIDEGAGGITRKPQVAVKQNLPSSSRHVNLQPEPDHDDVSNMYAKINKKKKPVKSVKGPELPVMHANELYSMVNKTKKTKPSLKAKPSGDVYAVVNKQKSGGKSSEFKGQDPESEVSGDVYTEVWKPK